jgi:putative ABC transport system permease protein
MRRFFLRWLNALRRDGGAGDLARELNAHLALLEDEYRRRGMTSEEARLAARRALGSTALIGDRHRDERSFAWVEDLRHDLAHTFRGLRRSPGFAALAIVALGLGIGVNTAFFTIVDATCLRGLPIDAPDRVLYVSLRDTQNQQTGLSWAEFDELRSRTATLTQLGAYTMTMAALADDRQPPARVSGAFVSAGTFELLGHRPVIGRTFRRDEDFPGGPQVVILGSEIWSSRFAGDPNIVGQSIRVNGIATTVIGVMPRGFMFPSNADVWRPMANFPTAVRESRLERRLAVAGRLTSTATLNSARAELAAFDIASAPGAPAPDRRARLEAVPINEQLNPSVWQRAWLAFITVGALVLLVACANVANLLLMRAATRGREIAIRTSIGATRSRIIRQLLVESSTLAAPAAGVGLVVAWAGLRVLSGILPPEALPYWMAFTIDARVLAVTMVVCVACVFACGLPSALHLSRVNVLGAITADSSASMARPARKWIGALLAAEFALTLVLVSLAVTAVRIEADARRREFQIDPKSVLTMWVSLPADWYPTPESRQTFVDRLEAPVSGDDAVGAIALATVLPNGGGSQLPVAVAGRREEKSPPVVSAVSVNDRYFDVLRVPLTHGRAFTVADGTRGNEAAIVNERFVRMFLAQEDPLEARIRVGGPQSPWLRIVGVATTVRQQPMGADAGPVVFLPFRAAPPQTMAIVVRTPGAIDVPVSLLRARVARLNPNLPVYRVMTFEEAMQTSSWNARLSNAVVRSIAVVALVLAVVGLYAVTGHTVERWRRELGLRVALGAGSGEIGWLVIRRVLGQLGIGLGVGVVGTQLFARLFNDPADTTTRVAMSDPAALVLMILSVGTIAVLACYPPIRRATRVDPIVALRVE